MRADKLYEQTLALLGEEECLSAYNTQALSRGEKQITCFEEIVNDGQIIPVDDNFAREVLCPLVAALLISDHDRDKANVLYEIAQRAIKKYSKVCFCLINNAY